MHHFWKTKSDPLCPLSAQQGHTLYVTFWELWNFLEKRAEPALDPALPTISSDGGQLCRCCPLSLRTFPRPLCGWSSLPALWSTRMSPHPGGDETCCLLAAGHPCPSSTILGSMASLPVDGTVRLLTDHVPVLPTFSKNGRVFALPQTQPSRLGVALWAPVTDDCPFPSLMMFYILCGPGTNLQRRNAPEHFIPSHCGRLACAEHPLAWAKGPVGSTLALTLDQHS